MRNLFLLLLISLFLLIIAGCDDHKCPTEPEPEKPPELGNYRLYIVDNYYMKLLVYDIPADTLVDSVNLDFAVWDMSITPDGAYLLFMNISDGLTEIYSTIDLSHADSKEYGIFYFDLTDKYGLFKQGLYEWLYFIDPGTLNPIDSINYSFGAAWLDTATNSFIGITDKDSIYTAYRLNCFDYQIEDSFDLIEQPAQIAYNWLTNDLYYFRLGPYVSYFKQYDIDTKSEISSTVITGIGGGIAISPDGRKIYMTDGGNAILGYIPPGFIWLFDAITNLPIKWIPPYDDTGPIRRPIFGQIKITPDGSRGYIGSARNSGGSTPLAIIDLEENIIIKTISPYQGFSASALVIGPALDN